MVTKEKVKNENEKVIEAAMDFSGDAGKGFENIKQDDLSIPFLSILQALSPELNKQKPEFIKGARAGQIIDSVSGKIVGSDEEPLQFIPCAYRKAFVEWKQRDLGGGFVMIHKDDSILKNTTRNDRMQDILPNGNIVVTTGYMVGLHIYGDEFTRCMISFTSTQLKKVRQWLSIMTSIKLRGKTGSFTPPMYAHIFDISTTPESNAKGTWYGWKIVLNRLLDLPGFVAPAKELMTSNAQLALPAQNDETDSGVTPF